MAQHPKHFGRVARFALVAGGIASFSVLALGQQTPSAPAKPQATFRTATDVVTLTVTVLDRQRRPVRGLTAADFTVTEEGGPRPIVAVEAVEVPTARPASLPVWQDQVVEDVVTNAPKSGRLVVIFFDRSIDHLSRWEVDRARKIAARAIDELGPEDVAAVVYNYHLATPLNFTSDRKRLLNALNSPVIATQPYPGLTPRDNSGDCFCGLCGAESIENVARALEPVRARQKMLVYIGGFIPLDEGAFASYCAPWLEPATAAMFAAAQRAGMVIHAVDPGGVRTPGAFSAGARISGGGGGPNFDSLRRLAENTGGSVVLGTNAPDAKVPRLFAESAVSYLVGFTPRTTTADGTRQRVRVQVRGQDLTVVTASSYRHAAPASAAPPLPAGAPPPSPNERAIAGLSPIAEIVMRASAFTVPDPAAPDRAAVATLLRMEIPVGSAASSPIPVEVEVTAFDTEGRPKATDRQTMTLTPQRGATTLSCELLSRLALPKGRYEIRAAVSVREPARTGSVYTFLDVDNFEKTPLAVSGLLLQAPAPRLITAAAPDTWLPVSPTTGRTFAQNARVTAGLRMFQPKAVASEPVQVTTQILDARGARIVTAESRVLPAEFDARRVADYRFELPLSTLMPGDYLVRVGVKQGKADATRTARFRVE